MGQHCDKRLHDTFDFARLARKKAGGGGTCSHPGLQGRQVFRLVEERANWHDETVDHLAGDRADGAFHAKFVARFPEQARSVLFSTGRAGLSRAAETVRISAMEEIPDIPGVDPKLLRDPVFRRVLEDALAIQDRFSAEPVYARTGKGYLKPTGVEEIREAKEKMKGENGTSLVREDP